MKKITIITALFVMLNLILFTACEQPAITSAKLYKDNKDFKQAIEQCNLALKNNPADPDAHYILGEIYAEDNMILKMNDAFAKSLEISPKYATEIENTKMTKWTVALNKGVVFYQQGKATEAAEQFLLATKILPAKAIAHKNLGHAYSDSKQYEKAIASFKKAYELDPTDMESFYSIGSSYYDLKDYEATITEITKFIEKSDPSTPTYYKALFLLAVSYDVLDKPEMALKTYKSALEKDPENINLKFNIGRLFIKREDWNNALEMFSAVFENNPEDQPSCRSMGECYLGLEKWADAVKYLKKATDLKPDDAGTWFWLGTAYARNGDMDNAKAAYAKNKELTGK